MNRKIHIDHYSNALFSIWDESNFNDQKNITKISKEIYYSLKENFELIEIVGSSIIDKTEKKEIIKKIYFNELNKEISSSYLYNFLMLLIDNDFFQEILYIFIDFFEKIDHKQNFIFLRIFSPYWLDEKTLLKIQKIFSKKTDKKVRYKNFIDSSLIGGIKIAFGDEIYDYSIKGHIEQIKWNLENAKGQ